MLLKLLLRLLSLLHHIILRNHVDCTVGRVLEVLLLLSRRGGRLGRSDHALLLAIGCRGRCERGKHRRGPISEKGGLHLLGLLCGIELGWLEV